LTDKAGEGDASGLIMVGDSIDDMTAGRKAGAATVLLVNDVNRPLAEHAHTDLVINTLDELVAVLDDGFVGREINPE
jgi:phosphoglycolate phosphatase-like HAD superfamily hydrolase